MRFNVPALSRKRGTKTTQYTIIICLQILKLMEDLERNLKVTEGVEFKPEAALFICTGLPKDVQRKALQNKILKKLRIIWPFICPEQIFFFDNVVEVRDI